MTPEERLDVLAVFAAVDLTDQRAFNARRALVTKIGLDDATIFARVRILQVMRLAFAGRRFDLEIEGTDVEPAAVLGVLDENEQLLDLAAWPLADPRRLATLLGRARMLGEHHLDAFAPLGHRVGVFRNAIGWLRAGCEGVVPIDLRRTARRFLEIDGELIAEDDAHGRELAAARLELVDKAPAILVREAQAA